jgi:hypothetical protein
MSGRFGRFDSRSLKQEPTMIWWWRWWMRWASTTNDSQKEMKQGQRKWSYVVWDFRLLTSTSDQRHSNNFCQRFRLDMGTLGGTPMPVGGRTGRTGRTGCHAFSIPIPVIPIVSLSSQVSTIHHPPRPGLLPLPGPACCSRLQTVAGLRAFA